MSSTLTYSTTHRSTSKNGAKAPKWKSLWYAYGTVRGFNSLLFHPPQVDRGSQQMTVKLWVFTTNRTLLSLRGNTRRKSARESDRRATDSPIEKPKAVACQVRIWESLLGQRKRGGCEPHISHSTLAYQGAKIGGVLFPPQCEQRKQVREDYRQGFVVPPIDKRRTRQVQTTAPPSARVGDFLRLGRGRDLPIFYQDSISIKNLSKKIIKKISKIFPKSLDKFK